MEIKFCKDCRYLSDKAYCNRPDGISLVTGEMKYIRRAAESERGYELTGCGTIARYFTLKQI